MTHPSNSVTVQPITPAACVTKQPDELVLQHVLINQPRPETERSNPDVYETDVTIQTGMIDPELFGGNLLEFWYQKIGCELVDIVTVQLLGKVVDIVVDDEGLLKPADTNGLMAGWVIQPDVPEDADEYFEREKVLVGNLVLSGVDLETGETLSCPLTKTELEQLIRDGRIRPVGVHVV